MGALLVRFAILFGVVFGVAYGLTKTLRLRAAERRQEKLDRVRRDLRALAAARDEGHITPDDYDFKAREIYLYCGEHGIELAELETVDEPLKIAP